MEQTAKKIAFLFPGQGSQHVGMGKESFETNQIFRNVVEKADRTLGFPISKLMFEGPEEKLTLTENAQPAIFTVSFGLFKVLEKELEGRESDGWHHIFVGAGHSLGEYTAVSVAGAMSFEDTLHVVRARGKFMQEAVPEGEGSMVAVMTDYRNVEKELEGFDPKFISISNINSETQTVVSGKKDVVDAFVKKLKDMKIRAIPLRVSAPFHSPLMEPAKERLSEVINEVEVKEFTFPVLSAHTLEYYTKENLKDTLLYGITAPVNFLGCVKKLREDGVSVFVEVGPGKVLTGLVKRIFKDAQTFTINSSDDVKAFCDKFSSF